MSATYGGSGDPGSSGRGGVSEVIAAEAEAVEAGPSASDKNKPETTAENEATPDTEDDEAPKLARELEDPGQDEHLAKRRKQESDSSGKRRKDKHQEKKSKHFLT